MTFPEMQVPIDGLNFTIMFQNDEQETVITRAAEQDV